MNNNEFKDFLKDILKMADEVETKEELIKKIKEKYEYEK